MIVILKQIPMCVFAGAGADGVPGRGHDPVDAAADDQLRGQEHHRPVPPAAGDHGEEVRPYACC